MRTLSLSCFLLATAAWACNVPVFRYALERWPADPYLMLVFHDGPLNEKHAKIVEQLEESVVGDYADGSNYIVDTNPIDLNGGTLTITSAGNNVANAAHLNVAGNDWGLLRINFGGYLQTGVANALVADAGVQFGWHNAGSSAATRGQIREIFRRWSSRGTRECPPGRAGLAGREGSLPRRPVPAPRKGRPKYCR